MATKQISNPQATHMSVSTPSFLWP